MLKLRLFSRSGFVFLSAFWRRKKNKSVFVFLPAFWRRKKKKQNFDLDPFGAFAFSERQFLVGGSFTILGTAFLVLRPLLGFF